MEFMTTQRKNFKDVSWDVSEEIYRKDEALSYSTLAKYEREGFNNLDKLFDKIETPSLTFGSAVDSIITGGQKEFDERFMVAEFPQVPDSIVKIVKALFSQWGVGTTPNSTVYKSLTAIPDREIIAESVIQNYQLNWKPETRAKVIKEKGTEYYNLLFVAGDKTILNTETYNDICNAVSALKNSISTKVLFADNNPFEPEIERLYQLKFKATLDNIPYRCMVDEVFINHAKKQIIPVDLKTSSKPEWDFYKSFVEWKYSIQARLYWRILRANMDKDDYYKDYTLTDYKFVVVNRKTLTPLVWDCPFTTSKDNLTFGKNNQIVMRDPEVIGKELHNYLTTAAKVPNDIYTDRPNNLESWLNTI